MHIYDESAVYWSKIKSGTVFLSQPLKDFLSYDVAKQFLLNAAYTY